jgi:thiamine biosynthesis lipoprotein
MHCCPPPERWVARAQPRLGTLVEIALPAAEATEARFAAAFVAVAHVHRRMSAHDEASDLGRIARTAHRRPVAVSRETYAVLTLAWDLFLATDGRFDVSIASRLARGGASPARFPRGRAHCGRMNAMRLLPGLRVAATRPVALDLGGIAKGYAVDRAVTALREAGARAGRVNAGGDLRVFGDQRWMPVRVRDPQRPTVAVALFDVRDAAVATSADYFAGGSGVLVDPRSRCSRPFASSITVVAPTCAMADALTKIVALSPARAPALLARHGAHAFRVDPGATQFATTCRASTAHLRVPSLRTE